MAYSDIRDLFVWPDWLTLKPGFHQCWHCRTQRRTARDQPAQDTRPYFCNRWCRLIYVTALLERHGSAVCPACFCSPGQPHRSNCAIEIGKKTNWRCALCGNPVDRTLREPDPRRPTFDHIVPQAEGGIKTDDNLRLAHSGCNGERRRMSDTAWQEKTGFSPL